MGVFLVLALFVEAGEVFLMVFLTVAAAGLAFGAVLLALDAGVFLAEGFFLAVAIGGNLSADRTY